MKRRQFLGVLAGGAVAVGLTSHAGQSAPAADRPNIVFIECDSMDGRVMGCMNYPAAHTPHLDALAARGVLFTNTYCNSPQCVPSRSSMWSGKYTHTIEGWNNFKGLSEREPTFLTYLEKTGYASGIFGKTDYVSGNHSIENRVSAWTRAADIRLPQGSRPKAQVTEDETDRVHDNDWKNIDKCVAWLKENAGKRPFFLHAGIGAPHPAFRTSRKWMDLIDPAKVTLPPHDKQDHPVMAYMRATKHCEGPFTDDEILAIRRTYYAMIAEVDAMVGMLIGALDELALTDSTYIVFTSDHGDTQMEHGQFLKNSLYEGAARVPLIIAGPGVQKGVAVRALASLIDMFPTLMDMARLPQPEGLAGHSLMPELIGENSKRPDYVFAEYHSNFQQTGSFMLREGNWKLIVYPGFDPQLFDLKSDPDEIDNLAASRPDIVNTMEARLAKIVDYRAVDARAKAYDKKSFLEWRAGLGPEGYAKTMRKLFKDWGPECDEQIRKWLGES